MEKIYFLIMLLGGVMVLRALYLLVWQIHFCRNNYCTVEDIANQQKACDKVLCMYFVFMALLWIWLECVYVLNYFKVEINMLAFNTIAIGVLGLAFYVYSNVKKIMMCKYGLRYFYKCMTEYRENLEEVTEYNEYEKNFIKSFKQMRRNNVLIVLWMIGALAMYVFVL